MTAGKVTAARTYTFDYYDGLERYINTSGRFQRDLLLHATPEGGLEVVNVGGKPLHRFSGPTFREVVTESFRGPRLTADGDEVRRVVVTFNRHFYVVELDYKKKHDATYVSFKNGHDGEKGGKIHALERRDDVDIYNWSLLEHLPGLGFSYYDESKKACFVTDYRLNVVWVWKTKRAAGFLPRIYSVPGEYVLRRRMPTDEFLRDPELPYHEKWYYHVYSACDGSLRRLEGEPEGDIQCPRCRRDITLGMYYYAVYRGDVRLCRVCVGCKEYAEKCCPGGHGLRLVRHSVYVDEVIEVIDVPRHGDYDD